MRVRIATLPGAAEKANEDAFGLGGGFLVVADGATARTDTGCVHSVAWYARTLADAAVRHAKQTPADALALAIRDTAAAHAETCDLGNVGTPGAAIAVVQEAADVVRFLALGDVAVVVESTAGINVMVDDRVSHTAPAERAAADALETGSPEKALALVAMKHAELAARNVEGGYWTAAADPDVVGHAVTWSVARGELRRAAVLSDGAARVVDPFGALDWKAALDVLAAQGPDELIRRVREIEGTDPLAERWPRNKISDDATVAYIEFG
jgi:hypothetical protein